MAKIEDLAPGSSASLNDDIGEAKRLAMLSPPQVVIREAEQRAYDLFLRNLVKGASHLSLGQEAVAAGFAGAIPPGDLSFCTYRGHAHTLARGVPIAKVLGELMQRDTGLMRGKGGSMHLTSVEHGVIGLRHHRRRSADRLRRRVARAIQGPRKMYRSALSATAPPISAPSTKR